MEYHRILTMQDISCVGQCSMTVALPILSACGQEVCILPTAVLSSHTGGFQNPHIHSLADDIFPVCDHWKREGILFDYILTGYLGSIREVDYARMIGKTMRSSGGKLIVDPAMADHGKLYKGFTQEYAAAMKELCAEADVIIPNITEAAMFAGMPYRECYDEAYIGDLVKGINASCVILTGVSFDQSHTGFVVAQGDSIQYYSHRRVDRSFHGTGDMFAAAVVGAMARGKELFSAAKIAADFTCRCIENTVVQQAHWYGVKFETALPELIRMLEE